MIDRLRPAYSPGSMTCLLAIAPSSYHYHHARLGVGKYAGLRAEVAGAFADSKGRYGYRRIKAVLKTGVSECILSTRRVPSYRGEVDRVTGRYVAGLSWLGLSGRWFSGLLHEGVGFAVAVALESDHPAVVDGTVD